MNSKILLGYFIVVSMLTTACTPGFQAKVVDDTANLELAKASATTTTSTTLNTTTAQETPPSTPEETKSTSDSQPASGQPPAGPPTPERQPPVQPPAQPESQPGPQPVPPPPAAAADPAKHPVVAAPATDGAVPAVNPAPAPAKAETPNAKKLKCPTATTTNNDATVTSKPSDPLEFANSAKALAALQKAGVCAVPTGTKFEFVSAKLTSKTELTKEIPKAGTEYVFETQIKIEDEVVALKSKHEWKDKTSAGALSQILEKVPAWSTELNTKRARIDYSVYFFYRPNQPFQLAYAIKIIDPSNSKAIVDVLVLTTLQSAEPAKVLIVDEAQLKLLVAKDKNSKNVSLTNWKFSNMLWHAMQL